MGMGKLQFMAVTFVTSLLFMCVFLHSEPDQSPAQPGPGQQQQLPPQTPPPPPREKQKVMAVRLLVLKHCRERIADGDANLAIRGAKQAESKGLAIKVIGNHYIDGFSKDKLQTFTSQEMWKGAVGGDTVIVHTIGHGGKEGGLATLGQRSNVMAAFANAAEANKQRVLWWQLSCYASAKLPPISSLPSAQQELFAVYASSSATEPSPTDQQAGFMTKLFNALADKSTALDKNGDGIVTAAEMKGFMNTLDGKHRGNLLYCRDEERPIFGDLQFAGAGTVLLPPLLAMKWPQE